MIIIDGKEMKEQNETQTEVKTETLIPKVTYYTYKECHKGFIEIVPGLFLGRKRDLTTENTKNIDVLIPLDSLNGEIWDLGYRGEIMYLPVVDKSVLPLDIEEIYAQKIVDLLAKGKKINLFCIGGHGRTGYIASIVLAKLGYKDPIGFIRDNYCKEAIESNSQVIAIADYLGDEELKKKYEIKAFVYSGASVWYDYQDDFFYDKKKETEKAEGEAEIKDICRCGSCDWFCSEEGFKFIGLCEKKGEYLNSYVKACECFEKF